MKSGFVIGLLIALLSLCGHSVAQSEGKSDTSQSLESALSAYAQAQAASNERTERAFKLERFNRAAVLFENSAQRNASNPDLWANAGTAFLQAEQLGEAIIAFKRALAIDPDHARSVQNLAHSRSQLPAWVPKSGEDDIGGTFFFWRQLLSADELQILAALVFLIASIVLGIALAKNSPALRLLGIGLAVIFLVLLAPSLVPQSNEPGAVLVRNDTVLRAADSVYAPARLAQALPPGTELSVIEQRESWSRVRLADGQTGWVPSGSAVLVEPLFD